MGMHIIHRILIVASALLVHASQGIASDAGSFESSRNRISFGYRSALNLKTEFSRGGSQLSGNAPSYNGKTYNNGFVGIDNTGNTAELTSYWGYENDDQIIDGTDFVVMRTSSAGQLGSTTGKSPNAGFWLNYSREIQSRERLAWGLSGEISWIRHQAEKDTGGTDALVDYDAFSLGYTSPEAPYLGSPIAAPFSPLLGTTPIALPVLTSSEFDASIIGFRTGPYVEMRLGRRLFVNGSAGVVLNVVNGQLDYQETYTTPSGASVDRSLSATHVEPTIGGYLGIGLEFDLTDQFALLCGAQYEGTTCYEITTADVSAKVDFRWAAYLHLGMAYRF